MNLFSHAALAMGKALRVRIIFIALVSSICSLPLCAQEPISLSWTLQQTLLHSPRLQEFPYQLRVSEARELEANLAPATVLDASIENVFGTGNNTVLHNAEWTLGLGRTIELGDKRARRVEVVRASARVLHADYELARIELLAESTRRYYQVLRIQALQQWIETRIARERDALGVIRNRAQAGAVGQADVSRIALRLAHSESTRDELGDDLALAKIRLASMWGEVSALGPATGDLAVLPVTPDDTALATAVQNAPTYLHLLDLERVATARLRLQEADNRADVSAGFGVRRFEADSDYGLLLSFSMPLGQRDRNRSSVAAARAELALTQTQQDILKTEVTLALREIAHGMRNQEARVTRIETTLLPLAQQLLSDTESGYQSGQYDVLQWLDAQAELFGIERELVETRTATHLQLLELEQITGQALSSMNSAPTEEPTL